MRYLVQWGSESYEGRRIWTNVWIGPYDEAFTEKLVYQNTGSGRKDLVKVHDTLMESTVIYRMSRMRYERLLRELY